MDADAVAGMNGCHETASAQRSVRDVSRHAGTDRKWRLEKGVENLLSVSKCYGAPDGPRTRNLRISNPVLLQFSFRRVAKGRDRVAPITASFLLSLLDILRSQVD